jgi:SAM-dependent methyltransferase
MNKLRRRMLRTFDRLAMRFRVPAQFVRLGAHRPARFALRWSDRRFCYGDATPSTGFDRHYIYHTAWAARVVRELAPARHVDIGSSLYFAITVSAFVPMEFIDYRPAELELSGLDCGRGDLVALPFPDGAFESLSCMHVLEHVGLGRYGDTLDYDGDLRAARELARVTAPGGHLIVVVPMGGQARIQFNAHRIYTYAQLTGMFPGMVVEEFALIPDVTPGGLIRHAEPGLADRQRYGCGCFLFRKAPSPAA